MKIALRAENYRDPFGYEQERRNVWSREWIMFCTTAELSKPGDYYAGELAGWNLLLTVNPQGEIIGFHNVCPHRAGVIAWPGNGTLGNLCQSLCRWNDVRERLVKISLAHALLIGSKSLHRFSD